MSLAIGAAQFAIQRLTSLFSQMTTPSTDAATAAPPSSAPTAPSGSCNALTGNTQAALSGDILSLLMQLQQGGASAASATPAAASTGGATQTDPVQSLFNAMDSNGDGLVSQSEMETYVEQQTGATQAQADALYNALGPSSGGVSESQMAGAAQQAGGAHHHHHHHHAGGAGGSDPLSSLMAALDGNQDGSVSQSEFTDFVTANGGTADNAASDFAALDTDKSGTLTSADFAQTWQNVQGTQGGSGAVLVSMLDAFAKANTATAPTTSVTA